MANSLLTPTVILNEAGRLFHQKASFIRAVNRNYDDRLPVMARRLDTPSPFVTATNTP
jgi:hypothetical protein